MLSMFKNKYPIRFEHVVIQDQRRYLGQFIKCIGRVGKDEIELLAARFQIAKHIAANHHPVFFTYLLQTLADKGDMITVGFYADHLTATTREQLQRDTARACKQVERRQAFEIDIAVEHVEDILLGKIGCRTRLNVRGTSKCRPLYFPVIIRIAYESMLLYFPTQQTEVVGHLP